MAPVSGALFFSTRGLRPAAHRAQASKDRVSRAIGSFNEDGSRISRVRRESGSPPVNLGRQALLSVSSRPGCRRESGHIGMTLATVLAARALGQGTTVTPLRRSRNRWINGPGEKCGCPRSPQKRAASSRVAMEPPGKRDAPWQPRPPVPASVQAPRAVRRCNGKLGRGLLSHACDAWVALMGRRIDPDTLLGFAWGYTCRCKENRWCRT